MMAKMMANKDTKETHLKENKISKDRMSKEISEDIIDTIDGKIRHKLGSIKIERIDGILSKKSKWTGIKWEPVCRFPSCSKEIVTNCYSLCSEHYVKLCSTVPKNHIIKRGCDRYKWNGKFFTLVCSIDLCTTNADIKTGKCANHNINANLPIQMHTIFNQVKDSIDSKIRKELKEKKYKEATENLENL